MPPVDDRLTPSQAARRLNVSPDRVRQMSAEGKLACELTPLGRLFRAADVEQLARQRAHPARPPVPR